MKGNYKELKSYTIESSNIAPDLPPPDLSGLTVVRKRIIFDAVTCQIGRPSDVQFSQKLQIEPGGIKQSVSLN